MSTVAITLSLGYRLVRFAGDPHMPVDLRETIHEAAEAIDENDDELARLRLVCATIQADVLAGDARLSPRVRAMLRQAIRGFS